MKGKMFDKLRERTNLIRWTGSIENIVGRIEEVYLWRSSNKSSGWDHRINKGHAGTLQFEVTPKEEVVH